MLNTQQSVTINGQSVVGESNIVAVYMSANVPAEGQPTINQTIQNKALYLENKEACDRDILAFHDKITSLMEG